MVQFNAMGMGQHSSIYIDITVLSLEYWLCIASSSVMNLAIRLDDECVFKKNEDLLLSDK